MKTRRDILKGALALVGMGATTQEFPATPVWPHFTSYTMWQRTMDGGVTMFAYSDRNPETLTTEELAKAVQAADEMAAKLPAFPAKPWTYVEAKA